MYELYLCHHGIKGQKWGIRRYQNADGSLTEEGQNHVKRYNSSEYLRKSVNREANEIFKNYKSVRDDLGSWNNVDDEELFELSAMDAGADLTKYYKATDAYSKFISQNRESISIGRQIVNSLK